MYFSIKQASEMRRSVRYFNLTSKKSSKLILLLFLIVTLTGCDSIFEFSPYVANVKNKNENTTAKNLELIKNLQSDSNSFKFAFITDTHHFYTPLRNVINDINIRNDISFVIFGGDIADQGLLKEYEFFHKIVDKLKKPYLTVIGNHDYKSNGGIIYRKMFGNYNYTFKFNRTKFILFDNIVWESHKDPDFDWLSEQLNKGAEYNHLFVIAHIPPFSDQLDGDMEERYKTLMKKNDVSLSIHGHSHSYFYEQVYNDNINYLIAPTVKKSAYCIVSIDEDSFDIELIEL